MLRPVRYLELAMMTAQPKREQPGAVPLPLARFVLQLRELFDTLHLTRGYYITTVENKTMFILNWLGLSLIDYSTV